VPASGGKAGDAGGQAGENPVQRQGLHDDAGGKRQHRFGRAVEQARECRATGARAFEPFVAGAGIGVAGVDEQRADGVAGGEALAA
jgi:hypothetical protein